MNRLWYFTGLVVALISLDARPAAAGMPSFDLTDLGALRVQAISFFGLGLFLSAAFIQALWNWLRGDFPRLPKLSFGKACAIVGLWGLLFVIVLAMISGARELMTPGAWEKNGATYKLTSSDGKPTIDKPAASTADDRKELLLKSRRKKLRDLGEQLIQYAAAHDEQFPADVGGSGVASEQWQLPGVIDMQYKYVPGATAKAKAVIVAYEPNVFDDQSLVLFADGRIAAMDFDDILLSLPTGDAP